MQVNPSGNSLVTTFTSLKIVFDNYVFVSKTCSTCGEKSLKSEGITLTGTFPLLDVIRKSYVKQYGRRLDYTFCTKMLRVNLR